MKNTKMLDINLKLDDDLIRQMEEVCFDVGITINDAFVMFAHKVAKEKKIPLSIIDDPFYLECNIEHLRRGVKELNEGKGKIHEIVEDYE